MFRDTDAVGMGLHDGQNFPSARHQLLAVDIGTANVLVRDVGTLRQIVQAEDRIQSLTLDQFHAEFGCPKVWH
jgi:hypothetical protein